MKGGHGKTMNPYSNVTIDLPNSRPQREEPTEAEHIEKTPKQTEAKSINKRRIKNKLIQSMHVNCRPQLNRLKFSVSKMNGLSSQGVH